MPNTPLPTNLRVTPLLDVLNQQSRTLNDTSSPFRPSMYINPKTMTNYNDSVDWSDIILTNTTTLLGDTNFSSYLLDDCHAYPDDGLSTLNSTYIPSSLIILTNGFCVSACALFIANLQLVHHVESVFPTPRQYTVSHFQNDAGYSFAGGQVLAAGDIIDYIRSTNLTHPDAPLPFPTSATMTITYRQVFNPDCTHNLEYMYTPSTFATEYNSFMVMRPYGQWEVTALRIGWNFNDPQDQDVCYLSTDVASHSPLCDVRTRRVDNATVGSSPAWDPVDGDAEDAQDMGDMY